MDVRKGYLAFLIGMLLLASCIVTFAAQTSKAPDNEPLASVSFGSQRISFRPKVSYSALVLTVSKPNGSVFRNTFEGIGSLTFELSGDDTDGSYTYELRLIPGRYRKLREEKEENRKSDFSLNNDEQEEGIQFQKPQIQTGYFQVKGGRIISGGGVEQSPMPPDRFTIQDVPHLDDVVITGSLGVGFDIATDGSENFGFDTIRLKEHNLRIHFDDTSYTASYPANDWRILINDTTNGGASYFSIEDSTAGVRPFTIEADAPANSLYVEDYGRVGLGTSTPVVELHIKDSDTPTLRLEQDSSGGWTAQTWDVAGNESNFFVRDATNGSKLPFRIQPNTPSSALCLKSDGKIGIGTWSPAYKVEVETTGENAACVFQRIGGATNYVNATASFGNFGTVNDYPLRLVVNGLWKMRLDSDQSLTMANGATCTPGGTWQNSSSIEFKENISTLSTEEAMDTLKELMPVKFNYKVDKDEKHVGFIAEEVPELVASKDRKGMSPMDVVAVLTKVVQQQQETIDELRKEIDELKKNK